MPSDIEDTLSQIKKRDGRIVAFDQNHITNAIFKAMQAIGEGTLEDALKVSKTVVTDLKKKYRSGGIPEIEDIQDIVEQKLILLDFGKAAKAYILYRHKQAEIRAQKKEVPEKVKELVDQSRIYLPNPYREFIYFGHYSRWIPEESRRETYIETTDRYMNFMRENIGERLTPEEYQEIRIAILKQESMPSMRLFWSAGTAARSTNVAAYNCAFLAPKKLRDFGELMYCLMCGTGVGFTVENHVIEELPKIGGRSYTWASGELPPHIKELDLGKNWPTHIIEDNKEGWADAFVLGLETWFRGEDINFDFSRIRLHGSRLKTMGGRASGPEPLMGLLKFSKNKILKRSGRRLRPIDVHDIICKTGDAVIMGGVRRSAELSLSTLDDPEMRDAKKGFFFDTEGQRQMANNSATYYQKPNLGEFLDEWIALIKSGSGERGIFNRGGLIHQLPERRLINFGPHFDSCGTNPCGEIVLRSKQFCNLTEVVVRPEDNLESLKKKVRIATIIGTYQSTLTNFTYLSEDWKRNCEEERLLGVSLTGQWDCAFVRDPEVLQELKKTAITVNEIYAQRFGINSSTCITCVKPSGTVSQLVDSASGMHARYAKYYIRRVEIDSVDPLFKMLKDQKVPYHPKHGQVEGRATTYVLEFPVKSPEGAITRNDVTAMDQLKHWKMVKTNYTEHNPSVTIYVAEDEWLKVANWLYENWDILGGLSFLPKDDHVYPLAPYEEISQDHYNELKANFPDIDYSQILAYEREDETKGSRELACVATQCDI